MMRAIVLGALFVLMLLCGGKSPCAAEKWQGIDETVVQEIAKEHGREAKKSLIDTGEGDLQLFAFLVAGAIGGFAAGYCWRMLLEGKRKQDGER